MSPDLDRWTFPLSVTSENFSHARAVSTGRLVYLMGRNAMLRSDVWTRSVAICAKPVFPRKKFAVAAIRGRVYVAGGSSLTSAVEEYDPETDSWRIVCDAPCRRYGCVGATTENGTWLHTHSCSITTVPAGGCILGACGIGNMLYIMASYALDISFSRWDKLKPPPVPGQVGTGLRFSCTAVGPNKVATVVHVSAVRGRVAAGAVNGVLLVYDVPSGEWTYGPYILPESRHTSCVSVEC
ncbi:F-box/kelch-repeat protein [Rhynchospora pubera]|uniref:F-box/kelch-repeat protein n=1 Tax=Rhynchospora pubera TaxID=906938 RepID=A0AAV8H5L9_9POAL|nr:F-box/kelch-repeat protein [Rhynchospora pubera]